ncbi:MAG: CRISPR-associated helicase Cas3', partial [Acidobacteria bacterium]|nr:CRISPR-associated helicase Cas3' [Acidobacteriota bacterium]
ATTGKNYETQERLFALGFWGKRYFSATVDQFLSFLEHSYSSLCLLPVLADSAVIIDEVHSFDQQMFKNLVAFLEHFDLPVLCMTATLQKSRREQLEKIGLRVYPNQAEQKELADLEKLEIHPRYNLEFTDNEQAALDIAIKEYKDGKRVLWVVNTVQRCQTIAQKLKKKLKIEPLVYHSRFRLMDRKNRHEETIKAFKQTAKAEIAVTTQVCEMSLDLDADVLITEFAPITSLVQRFGRANRHLTKGEDFRARLVVYKPEGDKPYTSDDITLAETFLRDLGSKDINQRFLAEKLDSHSKLERPADGSARFLESGYYATRGNFRDIDDFTNPCILSSDLSEVKKRIDNKDTYDAFVVSVPMPSRKDAPIWILEESPGWLPKHLKIADSKFYREHYGFVADLDLLNELEETEND